MCIDCGYLSGDAAPTLVAKDHRTGLVFVLRAAHPHAVEKLAEVVDALDSLS